MPPHGVLMQTHHGATLDYAVPSGVGEENLFPGLRAYLRERFGAEAGEARIEPLAVRAGGIKEGGYGVPHRVSWDGASGPRTLVLETVRPGPFGHEDPSDRAGILLRAYEDYGTLPRHVRAVDVGAFRGSGPAAQPRRLRGGLHPHGVRRRGALRLRLRPDRGARKPRGARPRAGRRARRLSGRDPSGAGPASELVPAAAARARRLRRVHRGHRRLVSAPVRVHRRRSSPRGRDARSRMAIPAAGSGRSPADDPRRLPPLEHPLRLGRGLPGPRPQPRPVRRSGGRRGLALDQLSVLRPAHDGRLRRSLRRALSRVLGPLRERSRDACLPEVIAPHFAFRALVLANPVWYPRESEDVRRRLFRFILSVLEAERFDAERIPALFERSAAVTWAVWLTGPPASGKTTVAREVLRQLAAAGATAVWLESDALRKILTPRAGLLAGGAGPLLRAWSPTSPRSCAVRVSTSSSTPRPRGGSTGAGCASAFPTSSRCSSRRRLAVREARDPKGLYRRARAGRRARPARSDGGLRSAGAPDLVLSGTANPEESADRLLRVLREKRLLAPAGSK